VTNRGGEDAPKDVTALRDAQAAVVHGIYRLVKARLFHTDSNDAVTSLTTAAATAVRDFCRLAAAEQVLVTFLGDAVFVNGQILKASRDTHALAAALGELLAPAEVTELTLARTITLDAVAAFAKLVADVHRSPALAPQLRENGIVGVKCGKASFGGAGAQQDQSPSARAARTYAASMLTVQRYFAELREGKHELPRRIKRVAQKLVAHADEDTRLLVALAASSGATADPAAIAVSSSILAVAMARQLTTDRAALTNVAMATLLLDSGRIVAAGAGVQGPLRNLNDDQLDRVPARSVVTLTAVGRLHGPARARTALVYEVWSMRRAHRLGQPYGGRRAPTLLARIIATARAFSEIRAAGAEASLGIDDAIQVLSNRAQDGTERALVKLLVGALGLYPAGTMVELNTGELGVVMATPDHPVDYVRPQVKILYDAKASLLESPIDLDLAAPRAPNVPLRFIRKNVDADEQQAKAMRAFVVAAQAAKRRAQLEPEKPTAPPPDVARAVSPKPPPAARQAPYEPTKVSQPSMAAQRPGRPAPIVEEVLIRRAPEPEPEHVSAMDRPTAPAPRPNEPVLAETVPPAPPPPSSVKRPPPAHLAAAAIRKPRPIISRTDSLPPSAQEEVAFRAPIARTDDADASPPPPDATRQVAWTEYAGVVASQNPDVVPTVPPSSTEEEEAPPSSKHDDLLAAFLADAPLDPDPE
jgi:hypothetical protein